jgi:transcriptional regulator with XRE-family HTH domain
MISKGAAALARLCEQAEKGQVEIATRLGEHQSLVSRWAAGERVPSAQRRTKLEDALGIEWRSWDEPVEEAPATERAS